MKVLLSLVVASVLVLSGSAFASQDAPVIGCDASTPHNCE